MHADRLYLATFRKAVAVRSFQSLHAMAEKLDQRELVSFKELLMSNSIQADAIAQLLIEKGFFSKDEFFLNLKQVQADYQRNG